MAQDLQQTSQPLQGAVTPKAPKPWNDIARSLDPNMSQGEYDDLKFQYFNTYVKPLAPPAQHAAYWQDFDNRTQRPKSIESPKLAQAKLAAISAGTRAQELLHTNPTFKKERDDLVQAMRHDGLSPDLAVGIGSAVPDVLAFAGIEAATGGVGGLIAEGAEAGSIALRARSLLKGVGLANRISKGALTFGTFEAISAKQGTNPGYAFLSGAGQGAAWELGFAGLGKVLKPAVGKLFSKSSLSAAEQKEIVKQVITPHETAAETEAVLNSKTGMREADKVVASHLTVEADKTRTRGLPLNIMIDDSKQYPHPRLTGVDAQGRPFVVHVKPYAESKAVEELQAQLEKGGQLQQVAINSNNLGDGPRILASIRNLTPEDEIKFHVLKRALAESGLFYDLPKELQEGFLDTLTNKMYEEEAKRTTEAVKKAQAAVAQVEQPVREEGAPLAEPIVAAERPQWEAPPAVQTEAPARRAPIFTKRVPTDQDILGALKAHTLPEGRKLTSLELQMTARKIKTLWHTKGNVSSSVVIARDLQGLGVGYMVPRLYRDFVAQSPRDTYLAGQVAEVKAVEYGKELAAAKSTKASDYESRLAAAKAQLESRRAGTTAGPTAQRAAAGLPYNGQWKLPDMVPMFRKGMSDKEIKEETGLTMAKVQSFRAAFRKLRDVVPLEDDIRIPAIDEVRGNLNTAKGRRNLIDVVLDRVTWNSLRGEAIASSSPFGKMFAKGPIKSFSGRVSYKTGLDRTLEDLGVDASNLPAGSRYAGIRMLPEDLNLAQAQQGMYHEDLHIQLGLVRGPDPYSELMHQLYQTVSDRAKFTLTDLAEGLRRNFARGYGGYDAETLLEEGFVHPAAAIRTGDLKALRVYANMDTSIDTVRAMVDEIASSLKSRLRSMSDVQELRGFNTRLEDLMRRTGTDRFSRWEEEALKQEKKFYIDAEREMVQLADERGAVTSVPMESAEQLLKQVPDHLEEHAGFEESVPSSTLQFERMGLQGKVFDMQAVVKGSGDKPTPHFLPKSEDRFRGIRAITALFQPMLSWASGLDEKFAKAGQKTGLYDLVKDVDEKVRSGMQWQDDMYTTASRFISRDPEHAKLLTPFMQANESAWPSMARRLGLDQKFLENATAAKAWLRDFQASTGIQVMNYFNNDLGRLQNFNYSPQAVWPRGLDKSELNRIARAVVNGELNPADAHFGHTAAWLIREGFEAKFTEQPLNKLKQLLNSTDAEGRSVLGPSKYNVANYIDYVRGVPDHTQQVILKSVGDFQKNLGASFAKFNKQFGTKLPTDFGYPGDFLQKYMLLSYVGGIGMRPAIWARDAMQAVTNSLPIMGPKKFMLGVQSLFDKGAWEFANDSGALLGNNNFGELYGDIFHEQAPGSGGAIDKMVTLSGKLLSPSRWTHNMARQVAFMGEYKTALKTIEKFRANKISVKELMEDTSMWFFDAPLQRRLLTQLMEKEQQAALRELANSSYKELSAAEKAKRAALPTTYKASVEEMAKRIALEAVDHTLWAYRRGTQPMFLRTGVGRLFGQYGLWPMSYIDFCARLTFKLAEHPQKASLAMGMWAAANQAATMSFGAVGGDVSKWFFISPASYGGSPHLQMAQAVGQTLENSEKGREARKTILEYPMNFIPAYIELKAVSEWISKGGNFFDEDWNLTPESVKILGMHPKSPELDLTPQEEIEYQAGFSHRR